MNELFKLFSTGAISASLAVFGAGCEGESSPSVPAEHHADDHHDSDEHHDGEMHGDEVHDHDGDDMHNHDDEVPLGTATIGDMEVEAFQGHGETEPSGRQAPLQRQRRIRGSRVDRHRGSLRVGRREGRVRVVTR